MRLLKYVCFAIFVGGELNVIAWLSDWLRDIIAVILLAVLVELLLPNKAMQRYARLVVGLFILLTILSPILRLLQTDMTGRLDASMDIWDEQSMNSEVKMPSLEQIQRRADELRDKRDMEAARLTERTLEEEIRKELLKQTSVDIESVDVKLSMIKKSREEASVFDIEAVTVTLKAREQHRATAGSKERREIMPVEPVLVNIETESGKAGEGNAFESGRGKKEANGFVAPEESISKDVQSVLVRNWGIHASRIAIRQRADVNVAE